MGSSLQLFYIPISNQKVANDIATLLLKEKLIACANIFPPHVAIYEWNGQVETEQETLMILKTLKSKAKALETRLKEIHPYDCPALISINPESTNQAFLKWVDEQVKES